MYQIDTALTIIAENGNSFLTDHGKEVLGLSKWNNISDEGLREAAIEVISETLKEILIK